MTFGMGVFGGAGCALTGGLGCGFCCEPVEGEEGWSDNFRGELITSFGTLFTWFVVEEEFTTIFKGSALVSDVGDGQSWRSVTRNRPFTSGCADFCAAICAAQPNYNYIKITKKLNNSRTHTHTHAAPYIPRIFSLNLSSNLFIIKTQQRWVHW